ncbi:hypothetical protein GOODEAATRI_016611 [Goodea atripinnis]|uniref:NADH dehydrogenase subunit 6 n=1 Tax=Goodea atripinnis TaxID=208336 RepID=A0ABV0MSL9_9TELE
MGKKSQIANPWSQCVFLVGICLRLVRCFFCSKYESSFLVFYLLGSVLFTVLVGFLDLLSSCVLVPLVCLLFVLSGSSCSCLSLSGSPAPLSSSTPVSVFPDYLPYCFMSTFVCI